MTREEILAMEPGRELDVLVAEKAIGQTGFDFDDTHWYCRTCKAWVHPAQVTSQEVHERCQTPVVADWCDEDGNVLPAYSTDISAAWEVLEKFHPYTKLEANQSGGWIASIKGHSVHSDTVPDAICIAALLAVMNA